MNIAAHERYLPAAGHDLFLPLYDPLTKLAGVDKVRRALIEQAELAPGRRGGLFGPRVSRISQIGKLWCLCTRVPASLRATKTSFISRERGDASASRSSKRAMASS